MINLSVKLLFLVIYLDLLLLIRSHYHIQMYLLSRCKYKINWYVNLEIIRIYYYPISARYSISFIPILTLPRSGLWVMYMYIYGAHLFKLKEFIALHVVYGNHAMLCSVKIPTTTYFILWSFPTDTQSVGFRVIKADYLKK